MFAVASLSCEPARATEPPVVAPAPSWGSISKEDFHGWPNTYRLANSLIEVRVTADVGPRILSFRTLDSSNVMHLRERELGGRDESDWMFRGGWRLWVAPEMRETTYVPDNVACAAEVVGDALVITGPPQPAAGIRKQIELRLRPADPSLRVTSRIKNISDKAVTYAAWSLSVMRPGGRALLPLDRGLPSAFDDTRSVIFWSYAQAADPRYRIGNSLVQVEHSQVKPPPWTQSGRRDDESKIGVDSGQGWAVYLLGTAMFLKRFPHEPGRPYPDRGSTVEVYSNVEFLELENLGPLTTIAPGEEIVLPEDWWIFNGVDIPAEEEQAVNALRPYLAKSEPVW